jgi:hypothetical protein
MADGKMHMTDHPTEFRLIENRYRPFVWSGGKYIEVAFAPLGPSQAAFLSLQEEEVLYGGTRANGKTLCLLMSFAMHVNRNWGAAWKGVLLRGTVPMFVEIKALAEEWFPRVAPGCKYNEQKSIWQFPGGESLAFRPFDQPSDFNNFLGHSYTWIGIEELTLWPNDKILKSMATVLRSTVPDIPLQIRMTTNPYSIGHNWVQARYRLHDVPGRILWPAISDSMDDLGHLEPPRRYVHGHIHENTLIMKTNPGYLETLRAATADNESKFNAWVMGSWDIVAGGLIDDLWGKYKSYVLIDDFEPPENWKLFRTYDHGSGSPGVVQYYALSDGSDFTFPNGKVRSSQRGDLYHIGEIYTWNGRPNEGLRLLPGEIARRIISYEKLRGWFNANGKSRVKPGPADTAIFADEDGRPSIAEDFASAGVHWTNEKNLKQPGSRIQGWNQLRKRIKAAAPIDRFREEAGLFVVHSQCPNWVRTVPTLARDEKQIDDAAPNQEDHCGDATRYALRAEILSGPSITSRRIG